MVKIVVSAFETREIAPLEFYQESWFAMAVRYGTALIAVLLVLILAVRPLIASTKPNGAKGKKGKGDTGALAIEASESNEGVSAIGQGATAASSGALSANSYANLPEQVRLARTLANEQPDRALEALQRMLRSPEEATN